jgi:hypothetical protein
LTGIYFFSKAKSLFTASTSSPSILAISLTALDLRFFVARYFPKIVRPIHIPNESNFDGASSAALDNDAKVFADISETICLVSESYNLLWKMKYRKRKKQNPAFWLSSAQIKIQINNRWKTK